MPILLVEDDAALRGLMDALLARRGIAAESVTRGDAALQAIERKSYDAIVLDLVLPGLSGFEVLEQLRFTHPHLLSRVVVVTALSSSALQDLEFEGLIFRLLRKPFDIDEFLNVVLVCAACHALTTEDKRDPIDEWFADRSATLHARTGVIAISDGASLLLRARFGFEPGVAEAFFPLSLDGHFPLCAAVRNRTAVWLASRTLAKAEYPLLLPIWTKAGSQAMAALPLSCGSAVVGAIGWSFGEPHAFDESSRKISWTSRRRVPLSLASPTTGRWPRTKRRRNASSLARPVNGRAGKRQREVDDARERNTGEGPRG
jgi:CheY-like chemotaxis protein